MATDCARRGIGSTGEKRTSFAAVPVVSGLSITAGVGSKEREGDLRRAMAIPFDVLESVIDAAEKGIEHATIELWRGCRGCSSRQMPRVW